MTAYLLFLLSNSVRMYVLHRFFRIFLAEKADNKKIYLTAYILFLFCSSILHLVFRNPVLNMACNLTGYFLLSYLYGGIWIRRGGIAAANYIVTMVTESLPFYLLIPYIPRSIL